MFSFTHSLFAWRFGVPGTKNKIIKGSETEEKKEDHQPRRACWRKQSKYSVSLKICWVVLIHGKAETGSVKRNNVLFLSGLTVIVNCNCKQ